MTHLPYVAACFGLGLAVPLAFAADAWRRLAQARRRLAQLDPRNVA
jgi:cytochrome c biogenesis protein CcdA